MQVGRQDGRPQHQPAALQPEPRQEEEVPAQPGEEGRSRQAAGPRPQE